MSITIYKVKAFQDTISFLLTAKWLSLFGEKNIVIDSNQSVGRVLTSNYNELFRNSWVLANISEGSIFGMIFKRHPASNKAYIRTNTNYAVTLKTFDTVLAKAIKTKYSLDTILSVFPKKDSSWLQMKIERKKPIQNSNYYLPSMNDITQEYLMRKLIQFGLIQITIQCINNK